MTTRTCNKCRQEGLTETDFYPSIKTTCKRCHRQWMRNYEKSRYRNDDPKVKTYCQVKDLLKKACLRIREESLGLRTVPLKKSDITLKEVITARMKPGMKWERYNVDWKITTPDLMSMINSNTPKKDLLDPYRVYTDFK